mgnify:FL=1
MKTELSKEKRTFNIAVENIKEYLKKEARNTDSWMSEVEKTLKEDIERFKFNDPEDYLELVCTFEEEWRWTDYFHIKIFLPVFNVLEEKTEEEKMEFLIEDTYDFLDKYFWEEFHNTHDTYEIAKKLLKKRKDELNVFKYL